MRAAKSYRVYKRNAARAAKELRNWRRMKRQRTASGAIIVLLGNVGR